MPNLNTALVSLDSGVTLDFHLTKSTDVLMELFEGKLLYSDFVKNELPPTVDLRSSQVISLSDDDWDFFNNLKKNRKALGVGEIGAIVVAKRHEAILLTNDKCTRTAGEDSGVHVISSIGVLDFAVERGKMLGPSATQLLHEMITHGARVTPETFAQNRQRWSHETKHVIKQPALVRSLAFAKKG